MACLGCTGLPLANCNDGCADCDPTNAVGLPDCPPSSEPCEDLLYSKCVKYAGPNLPTLGITNGMRMKDALIALNKKLTVSQVSKTYTITVSSAQTTTIVEYIDVNGLFQTKSVSKDQSPQSICAQNESAVIISGTGILTNTGANC